MRRRVLGVVGVLLLAGAAGAKPPGLPADPRPEGRESDPTELLFHTARPRVPANGVADEKTPRGEYSGWLRLLQMPLGLARVGEWF